MLIWDLEIFQTLKEKSVNLELSVQIFLKLYPLNELISNLMPATGLKIFGTGNKGLKKQDILKRFSWENI